MNNIKMDISQEMIGGYWTSGMNEMYDRDPQRWSESETRPIHKDNQSQRKVWQSSHRASRGGSCKVEGGAPEPTSSLQVCFDQMVRSITIRAFQYFFLKRRSSRNCPSRPLPVFWLLETLLTLSKAKMLKCCHLHQSRLPSLNQKTVCVL